MDLFTYPDTPGFKEATTSRLAAASMEKSAPTMREAMLAEWRRGEGTYDEIAKRCGFDKLAARPRGTECKVLGLIEPTGERRKNDSGRMAKVWRLAA